MKKRVLSEQGRRHARLGRKAIASGRIASSIELRASSASNHGRLLNLVSIFRRLANYRPNRWQVVAMIVVILVLSTGFMGYGLYQKRMDIERMAAQKILSEKARVASQRAAECRKTVAESNPEKVGKLTYAELYGSECEN